jgi:hypothetical protein
MSARALLLLAAILLAAAAPAPAAAMRAHCCGWSPVRDVSDPHIQELALLQKMISKDAPFFFSRGGCKYIPLLQQELGTVAFRPPLEMHLQGRVTAPPAPENRVHFQPSLAPGDPISRGGRCHQPPLEMRPIFRGGWWHHLPLENYF